MPKRLTLTESQVRLISKALSDPRRHEILQQLGERSCAVACSAVRESQTISAATLSHHMKELETAGLISVVRKGKFAELTLQRDVMKAYIAYLKSI